jgi:hypothetical protein
MEKLDDQLDDAIILMADTSLLRKIGGIDLDKALSPEAIKKAEVIIADASDELYVDCVDEAAKLQPMVDRLRNNGADVGQSLTRIIATAFSIKSKAGQSGYDLVSALAKSLHVRCEEMSAEQMTPTALEIIAWHVQGLRQILALRIKGNGGKHGEAILAELKKLEVAFQSNLQLPRCQKQGG